MIKSLPCVIALLFAVVATSFAEGEKGNTEEEKTFKGVKEVRAYRINWDDMDAHARMMTEDGKLNPSRLPKEGTLLNEKQVARLYDAVTGDHEEVLGAFCFFPHHGFVFFDEQGKAVGHITICFMCSQYRGNSKDFAKNWDLEALEKLFVDLGHPLKNENWDK